MRSSGEGLRRRRRRWRGRRRGQWLRFQSCNCGEMGGNNAMEFCHECLLGGLRLYFDSALYWVDFIICLTSYDHDGYALCIL